MPQNNIEVGLAGALPGTAEIFDLFDGSHGAEQHEASLAESVGAMAQGAQLSAQAAQMSQENAHTIHELQGQLVQDQADIMHAMGPSAMPIDQAFGADFGHGDHGFE